MSILKSFVCKVSNSERRMNGVDCKTFKLRLDYLSVLRDGHYDKYFMTSCVFII